MKPQYWSNAATLMLAARTPHTICGRFDYKLLMLRRSPKSSFMKDAFVFPGGRTATIDTQSNLWSSLFKKALNEDDVDLYKRINLLTPKLLSFMTMFPTEADKLANTEVKYIEHQPYTSFNKNSTKTDIDAAWGIVQHRLTAIRETFEEVGILLYTNKEVMQKDQNQINTDRLTKSIDGTLLQQWQKRVNENSDTFYTMFQELDILPDVWALSEWSNWLTPTHLGKMHGNRRFDTMFYITYLSQIPEYLPDGFEIVGDQWCTPHEALEMYKNKECYLAPPQYIELSRLGNFTQLDDLKKFSLDRNKYGVELTMPVVVKCADSMISILPGDYLYPSCPDYFGVKESRVFQQTAKELRGQSQPLNRVELIDRWNVNPVINVQSKHGHVLPNYKFEV